MSRIRLQAAMVVGTVLIFLTANGLNEWFFSRLEFANGMNWVFLPAGIRLLSTLVFGAAGALGLLVSGFLLNFFHFHFNDPLRSIAGAFCGSAGPYLVYLFAARRYGLAASLASLTPQRLLLLILLCSAASPAFHNLWFALHGGSENILRSYIVMFTGDLTGTLIVIYTIKAALALLPDPRRAPGGSGGLMLQLWQRVGVRAPARGTGTVGAGGDIRNDRLP
jgi:hypothetical protein